MKIKILNCENCGMMFIYKGRGRHPKYCPECRIKIRKKYKKSYMREYMNNKRIKERELGQKLNYLSVIEVDGQLRIAGAVMLERWRQKHRK